MPRILKFAFLSLVLAIAARAQNTSTSGTITSAVSGCASSSCVYFQVPVVYQVPLSTPPWVIVTVSGTWSGQLQAVVVTSPTATAQNLSSQPWSQVSTITGNGNWSIATGGATFVLIQAQSLASGAAQVTITSSVSSSPVNNPVFPGALTANGLIAPNGGSNSNCWYTNGGSGSCGGGGGGPSTIGAVAHKYVNSYTSTTGLFTSLQPSSGDLLDLGLANGAAQLNSSGILPRAQGGTGENSLSGIRFANSSSPDTAASAAQIVAAIGSTPVSQATTAGALASTLGTAGGGTGNIGSLTGVLYGNSASPYSVASAAQIGTAVNAYFASISSCLTTNYAYTPANVICQPLGSGGGASPNMVITTTNYTFASSNLWVRFNISTNSTATLPANACSTLAGWNALIELSSASTATLTIAPNGNTYDGITTQLQPGQSTFIQTDGSACHSTLPFSSLPIAANLPTQASAAAKSNLILQSAGANKTIVANDYPEPFLIPAANTNGSTPGSGWSLPASGAPTLATRTGSNIIAGVLQFAASQTAQFQIRLPFDYDSAGTTNAVISFSQGSNTTSGQTIIMQMATGCGATDDPSFNTAQAFSTVTTGTTARTMYNPTLSGVTMTSCSAGQMMNVKISRSGSDTATTSPDIYSATITIPRAPVVQPN